MATKACPDCKRVLQEEDFHIAANGERHKLCRVCRSQYERQRRKKKTDQRLDKVEKDAVELFCRAATVGGGRIPHTAELIETLMEYMGGVRGFANLFMKQYWDSTAGGAFRTKQLEAIVRLISANTAMGGAKKPLSQWSEEELEEELRQRVMEAAITIRALPAPVVIESIEKTPTPDTGAA